MERSTIFNGKTVGKPWETMGKPWENHGKMVIYMENQHHFEWENSLFLWPWLQVRELLVITSGYH